MVTGTTLGTITSDSGKFTLRNVPADAKSIEIRRIGYTGATVVLVKGQTEYAVALKQDVLHLEQEVITGVATTVQSKNAVTYDPVVTAAQLNGAPSATIENALQGKVAGVQIDQNSGAPGGGLQVNVRGVTSINGNTEPLYVVDGVIVSNAVFQTGLNAVSNSSGNVMPSNQDQSVNRIADLNPNDIESMQVLEGAAAASIYGSRAAAGVVVITTKKGSVSKPEIDATQKVGHYELEHTFDARRFTLPQAYALGATVGMSKSAVLQNYNECNGYCDLQSQLYGNKELSNETNLTIRGGTPTTTYFLSGLTKYDNGTQINTGYNKQSARASVNQSLFSTITVAANLSYTSSLNRTGVNGNDNFGISGYDILAYTPSFFCMSCQQPGGGYVNNPWGPASTMQDATEIRTPDEVNRTTLGGTVNWKLFTATKQSLEVAAVGGADFVNEHTQFFAPGNLQVEHSGLIALPGVGTSNEGYDRLTNWSVSLIHKWTPSSLFSATTSIGLTRDKDATYQTAIIGNGLPAGGYAATTAAQISPFYQQTESNDAGYYVQEQLLLFNDRMSVTGGVNAERSTNNGAINKLYPYPKIAGSFRVLEGATELKLRAAYGQAGTLPIYGVKFDSAIVTNYNAIASTGFASTKGDPNVRPETNTSIETGADLTMFKGRMALNATVFQKRVTNLLLSENVLPSAGYASGWTNGGQITDQGLELALNATPLQVGKFTWSTSEVYSRVYDRVDALPIPPFAVGNFFGYQPFGGYQIETGASANAVWGITRATAATGKLVQLGNAAPALTLGFGNDLNYGAFHIHAFLDWRDGMKVVNLTQQYWDYAFRDQVKGLAAGNFEDTLGTAARLKVVKEGASAYIQGASFVKLRELTGKWDLPQSFINRVGQGVIRHMSLIVTGRNLFTWTKYPGLDPEVSNFGIQQLGRGQDVTPYPPSRAYFVALDLGF